MSTCDFILDANIVGNDCALDIAKGAKSKGVIINRADIDMSGVTYGNPYRVSALPLVSGKKAYTITQPDKAPFSGTQTEMQEGTYLNTFDHTISLVILNNGELTAQQVDELVNGEYVVILENNAKSNVIGSTGTATQWQVYGLQAGLKGASAVRELYNDDVLSGWVITLTEVGATKSAIFIDASVVESLLS